MRYWTLIVLLFFPLPVWAQSTSAPAAVNQDKGTLISDIRLEGFELQDKDQFVKLFKPYRNKHLTRSDMDDLLSKVQVIYEKEGYQQLVTITYQVTKRRLVFTALMTT